MSLIAAVTGVSGALIWSMSANDPYWRLLNAESVPATTYEARSDLDAVVTASSVEEFSNPDIVAISPAVDGEPGALSVAMAEGTTETVQLPEAAPAQVPTVAEDAAIQAEIAPVVAAAPAPMQGPEAALIVVTFERPRPLAPVQDWSAESSGDPMVELALTPFANTAAPAQPHIAATEVTEEALGLERAQRVEVQRRLALAGFDPRGADGDFGPNTRSAISDFQVAWGYPATGYLEDAVYAELNERTEAAYQAMRQRAAAQQSTAPVLAAAPSAGSAEPTEKCVRRSDGQIIERQSLACDIAGFAEQFVSMGRTSFDAEDGAPEAAAFAGASLPRPGVER